MSRRPAAREPAEGVDALLSRLSSHLWLKAVGTTVGMGLFFVGYFAIMRLTPFAAVAVPATWLDHQIPFQSWTLVPYVSLWLYISLAPALMTERRLLWSFAGGCLGLTLAGYAVFYIYPTVTPTPDIDWSRHPSIAFLKNADVAGNACPSLHVAFACFTALWFERLLPALGGRGGARLLNASWACLIVYSTIGLRQHVALDAYWGGALGAWAASLNFIFTPCRSAACATPRPLFLAVAIIKACAVLLWTSGVSTLWSAGLFLSGGALVLWHLFAPGAQGLARTFRRFKTTSREVWLTIDDGPSADTPALLDLLDLHGAKATFFLVGDRAATHPDLVEEIQRRGHELGHHTQSHPGSGLWALLPTALNRELDVAWGKASPPRRFRAPVGIKHLQLAAALERRGLTCIGWTLRSGDSFARSPVAVANRVLRRLKPGAIILMHEGPFLNPTVRVEAIRQVIEGALARGYRFTIPRAEDVV